LKNALYTNVMKIIASYPQNQIPGAMAATKHVLLLQPEVDSTRIFRFNKELEISNKKKNSEKTHKIIEKKKHIDRTVFLFV